MRKRSRDLLLCVGADAAGAHDGGQLPNPLTRHARSKMCVPFPPGGGIDVTARIAAEKLADVLGQPIIIVNQGGVGGGAIATDAVVRSNPDGYTLLYHSVTGIVHALGDQGSTLRLAARSCSRVADHAVCAGHGDQPEAAGEDHGGIHRALESKPRKIQLRIVRHRHRGSSLPPNCSRKKPASTSCISLYHGTVAVLPDLISGAGWR